MKKLITAALSLLFVVCVSYTAVAGSIDSPGAPSAGSGMYTLQNLYDYLTSGTALTVQTSFQEPTTGPTAGTMKTTKQIGDAIKALLDQSNVGPDNVESGKRFFCTQAGSWGIQTGTLSALPRPTATPTATTTPTITPTPTITITPTPTWGPDRCATKTGTWSLDGLGSSGCWFQATSSSVTCNYVCSTEHGLNCLANTNDPDCAVCKAINPGNTGCGQLGYSDMPWYGTELNNHMCYWRSAGVNQACTEPHTRDVNNRPLCVCQP
ncbi:MAG: hypothetical protein NTZ78_01810 [Candidatus Aureabacteria bacterium]|nr:hypothetical protein [Candidatus Auribacterota bacterium]